MLNMASRQGLTAVSKIRIRFSVIHFFKNQEKITFFFNKIEMNDKIIRISLAEKRKYCDLIKSGANYSQKSLLFSINKFLLGKKVP